TSCKKLPDLIRLVTRKNLPELCIDVVTHSGRHSLPAYWTGGFFAFSPPRHHEHFHPRGLPATLAVGVVSTGAKGILDDLAEGPMHRRCVLSGRVPGQLEHADAVGEHGHGTVSRHRDNKHLGMVIRVPLRGR